MGSLKYEDLEFEEVELLLLKRLREAKELLREIRDLLREAAGGVG